MTTLLNDLDVLTNEAKAIRLLILDMANRSSGPHVGSCLSCVECLAYLYFRELRLDPQDACSPLRDYFLLSKGHAAMALYAVLARKGVMEPERLLGYMQNGGTLPAHLDRFSGPGIEISAGALGHGLPIGLGLAHGMMLNRKDNRVFVLMGDGESQEGSVWEAAMMAPRLGVENLTAVIDCNRLQGYGRPNEIMHFEPVAAKWEAFGWSAFEADGHDFVSLGRAFAAAREAGGPAVIVMETVKGKGVSFMEDALKWHYYIVTDEILAKARKELLHA